MARRTEKKMKEAGFKFGFGVGKPTSNLMEGIRRRLSKTGLSAADRKKLKELQEKVGEPIPRKGESLPLVECDLTKYEHE